MTKRGKCPYCEGKAKVEIGDGNYTCLSCGTVYDIDGRVVKEGHNKAFIEAIRAVSKSHYDAPDYFIRKFYSIPKEAFNFSRFKNSKGFFVKFFMPRTFASLR